MLVYSRLVIFVLSGVSGESECVAYKTRSVHEGTRLVLKEKAQLQRRATQLANTLPILVHLPKFVLVAAFKLPEVTFPEANKYTAFPLLNRELVEFLELFSRFF